ncbi:LysR family transcriptional regulator [Mycolicibacterium wolinskyi]|uniref:Probable hydrogen peroxide-inducible genes activator n=1 Tax=Mycolicibacterium wolinskyi TaxID=59750 RepID=A0A132PRK0_9MYCO|nr:LysR substrate-binding domain-containing protein [Mycolicibacterium wolinskyi]KWX24953.1 LysR family transcriptional regulator [Mycolicibacterium wolinskyi]
MDLRSVECFIRVAETLHFGRAATDLHLSQPALSQRIRTLERDVGATLLDRDRRGVRLTAAGLAFLAPARAMLAHGEHAIDVARRAEQGLHGRLRLGFTVVASYTRLPRAVQRFRSTFPDITIDLVEFNSPAVEEALDRGEIDVGVLHPPLARTHLRCRELPDEPLVLALPTDHPLCGHTTIGFGDLAGEALLAAPRSVGPVLFDKLVGCFRSAGVEPDIVQEATPVTTLAGLVAAGAGIGFVTRGVAAASRPGVVFREVVGAPGVPMAIAWTGPKPPPTARRFLDVVDEVWRDGQ